VGRKIPKRLLLYALVYVLVVAATVTVRVQVTFVQPGVLLEPGVEPVIQEGSNCYLEGTEVICI